jgi:hypothetical protein
MAADANDECMLLSRKSVVDSHRSRRLTRWTTILLSVGDSHFLRLLSADFAELLHGLALETAVDAGAVNVILIRRFNRHHCAVVDVIRRTSFKYSKAGLVALHVVGDLVHELCIEICRRGAFQCVSLTFDMS